MTNGSLCDEVTFLQFKPFFFVEQYWHSIWNDLYATLNAIFWIGTYLFMVSFKKKYLFFACKDFSRLWRAKNGSLSSSAWIFSIVNSNVQITSFSDETALLLVWIATCKYLRTTLYRIVCCCIFILYFNAVSCVHYITHFHQWWSNANYECSRSAIVFFQLLHLTP